jgi:hypothetical protein
MFFILRLNKNYMNQQSEQYREALKNAIMQSDVIKIFDNLLTIAVEE